MNKMTSVGFFDIGNNFYGSKIITSLPVAF